MLYLSSPSRYTVANLVNMWLRYGFDLIDLQGLFFKPILTLTGPVNEALNRWQKLYDTAEPWFTLPEFLSRFGLTEFTNVTLSQFLQNAGYSKATIEEIVSGMKSILCYLLKV